MDLPATEKITDDMTMDLASGFDTLMEVLRAFGAPEGEL